VRNNVKLAHHRQEDPKLRVKRHNIAIREDELFLAFFLGHEHDVDLLGCDRQHRQLNAIELVETAPRARLCQALEDATEASKIHLIRTVEDDDVLAECLAHVFGGLSLASTRWTGRSSAQ